MRHRHNGPKVRYRTRRNRIMLRERPTHSQMDKYKNLNYNQLRKRFRINPLADDDKDRVPNYKDCKPWDKRRHGMIFGRYDPDRIDNPAENPLHPDSLTPEMEGKFGDCHTEADKWAREHKGIVLRSETGEHSIAMKGSTIFDYVLGYEGNKGGYTIPHEFSEIANYEEDEED